MSSSGGKATTAIPCSGSSRSSASRGAETQPIDDEYHQRLYTPTWLKALTHSHLQQPVTVIFLMILPEIDTIKWSLYSITLNKRLHNQYWYNGIHVFPTIV